MNIELVKLTPAYKTQLFDMLTEWKADIENSCLQLRYMAAIS